MVSLCHFFGKDLTHFGSLCHLLGPNLKTRPFRELFSHCGTKSLSKSGACVSLWAQNGPVCGVMSLFCVQICAEFGSLCHFLGPNLGSFESLCHFFSPKLSRFRELVSLFGSKFWPNSGACVTFWDQICARFGSLCNFLDPNLGPFRELVPLFGAELDPFQKLVLLFVPEVGPISGACVTFCGQIWAKIGSLCHF